MTLPFRCAASLRLRQIRLSMKLRLLMRGKSSTPKSSPLDEAAPSDARQVFDLPNYSTNVEAV